MTTPQRASRPMLYALGGLLALVAVLLGVVFWLLAGGGTSADQTQPTPDPSSDPAAAAGQGAEPDTGTDTGEVGQEGSTGDEQLDETVEDLEAGPTILVRGDTSQGWTIETPDGFSFYPVGPPGPAVFSATESSGFAQSPEGAGLAAIHILQRINPAANSDWERSAEAHLVGVGKAAVISAFDEGLDDDLVAQLREASAFKSAWVGWNLEAFDPQQALITLAGFGSVGDDVIRYTLAVRLEWLDDDWRLVVQEPGGGDLDDLTRVASFGTLDVDMTDAYAL